MLWDLYQIFGMTRQVIGFNINTASSSVDLRQKTEDLKRAIQRKLGGKVTSDEIGIPVSSKPGRVLPCGASAVWTK